MNRMKNVRNKSSHVVVNIIFLVIFFIVSVNLKSQPANDDCANAINITPGSSCVYNTYTNLGATTSAGAPAPGCASYSGGDVWFRTTVPSTGHLTFDTNTGGITDGGMAIYSGSCGSLTLIECDDDDSNNGLMPKIDRSGLTPGSTIYIRFWEYGGDTYGSYSLCVYDDSPPPVTNDNCTTAIPITIGSSCSYTNYSNVGATASSGPPAPGCASYSTGDVWFSCTVPSSGSLIFDSQTGTLTDCGMAIYYGPCTSLTLIECDDDDSPNGAMPMISRTGLTPGATVFIRFWDYGGTDFGSFGLCVYEPPTAPPCATNPAAGDLCSTPTPICNLNGYCGSTSGTYTADIPGNLGSIFCGSIENNSWLSFVADATSATLNLFVSNCTDGYGIQMQIYSVTGCSTFTSVSNCFNPGTPVNGTVSANGLTIGQTYYVMIDGNAGDVCDYVISASSGVFTADAGPDVTICGGQNAVLNATGGSSYTWSPTSSLSNPNISNPTASPSVTTTYTVSITGGNPLCPGIYTDQVTVFVSGLTPTASNNGPLCSGQNLNLTSTPSAATSYSWSGPNGFTSNLQNPSVLGATPVASGTYTVTVTNGGCTGTASTTVNVSASASITASASPASVCPGQSSTLSASGASTYVWSSGSTTVNPTVTTTYSVTGTTASGCTGTATVLVTVNPNIVVSATASPASVCSGQTSTLAASGGSTYQWSNGSSGASVSVNPTATTTYSVTGTSASGCSGTTTVTVTVNSNATITASASPAAICSGESSTISASGGSTYVWSPSGSGTSFTANPTSTTTYSVTGTTANGCSGTATVTLTVNPLPNITAAASPAAVCVGFSTTISGGGGTSYVWNNGQNTASFSEIPAVTTTYNVTGTDANNCSNTADVTVTLMTGLTVNITPSVDNICEGESTTLTASSPGSGVGYSWDTGASSASIIVSPTATTTYSITGTDATGCSGTVSAIVNVEPMPLAGFTAGPLTGCDPTVVNFTDQSSGNITIWDWEFGDGGISGLQNPSHTYGAGTYSVTLTVTTAAGCQSVAAMNNYISILSNPNAAFTAKPAVTTEDEPTITFINQSTGATIFTWSFGDDIGTDFTENPIYSYIGSGLYLVTLWVENAAGCADSTTMMVNIKPSYTFYLPNAFSPNGDGRNEVLRPSGTGWDSDTYSMRIYSRWGELVFSTTDINHGWNGLLPNGAEALQGVYSVIIRLRGLDGTERDYYQGVGLLR